MRKHETIRSAFENWSGESISFFQQLPPSGSNREYYRIKGENKKAIVALNPDRRENEAYIYLTNHLSRNGINVPEIYAEDLNNNVYLIQDLGNTTLFDQYNLGDNALELLKRSIEELPRIQMTGIDGLDFNKCYPRAEFDRQSILWDLSYFKYYFLKLAGIQFDEQLLEDDFNMFADYLMQADSNYFMYRDFQARNIMVKDDELYYIDFQGGRRGALQYDLASMLFSARLNLSPAEREELLNTYLESANNIKQIDERVFKRFFYPFVLIRVLQAFGAYGYRGYYERKGHFLKSIPSALENLEWLFDNINFEMGTDHLFSVLKNMIESRNLSALKQEESPKKKMLTLNINSFSYRKGLPLDTSGNGGGFVFDCRFVHNPGRYEEYKTLTGKDLPVKKFLDKEIQSKEFIDSAYHIIQNACDNYIKRGFENLQVNFGCTGGQHRSVYFAERLKGRFTGRKDLNVVLKHRELEKA